MILKIVHFLFFSYTALLAIRIVGSWFPRFATSSFMRHAGRYTDPYLNLFRKIIPPIGGTLDLSPMLGYLTLQLTQTVVEKFLSRFL
ncbi:MAG: YggT family protein [Anaerolineae bacterium]